MSSTVLQPCSDLSDILPLCETVSLYLKPIARVMIAVQLPKSLASTSTRAGSVVGKTISNWEVMEKIKGLAKPIVFSVMKVTTSTLEVIRYEGEVDNKELMLKVMHQLEDQTIKLSGFSEVLRVHCTEAKLNFPQRHDWTAFFRDAQNLNELKPGERPDTVVLQNLPCKWFSDNSPTSPNPAKGPPPTDLSEGKIKDIFSAFGKIRAVDIPMCDPSRSQKTTGGISNGLISFGHEVVFEAFIQFAEYTAFVKCLTALNGMKLLWKEGDDKAFTASIKVEFDKTQHMSDRNIRKRRHERTEYRRFQKVREEKEKREMDELEKRRFLEEQRKAEETMKREEKQKRREERRRQRRLLEVQKAEQRKKIAEERKRQHEVMVEERKLLIAQRQLESIRLLSAVFERLKEKEELKQAELLRIQREEEERRVKAEARQQEIRKEAEFRTMLEKKERELRVLLLKSKSKKEKKRKKREERLLKRLKRIERHARRNNHKILMADVLAIDPKTVEVSMWLNKNFPDDAPRGPDKVLEPLTVLPEVKQPDIKVEEIQVTRKTAVVRKPANIPNVPKLTSVVVVVPVNEDAQMDLVDGEQPVFEAPLNILYC